MTTCPACEREVDADQVLADRECPECGTALDDLYRLANGLPTRTEQDGFLTGRKAR